MFFIHINEEFDCISMSPFIGNNEKRLSDCFYSSPEIDYLFSIVMKSRDRQFMYYCFYFYLKGQPTNVPYIAVQVIGEKETQLIEQDHPSYKFCLKTFYLYHKIVGINLELPKEIDSPEIEFTIQGDIIKYTYLNQTVEEIVEFIYFDESNKLITAYIYDQYDHRLKCIKINPSLTKFKFFSKRQELGYPEIIYDKYKKNTLLCFKYFKDFEKCYEKNEHKLVGKYNYLNLEDIYKSEESILNSCYLPYSYDSDLGLKVIGYISEFFLFTKSGKV